MPKNAKTTLYMKKKKTLCNTLNWGNWNSGFVKLGVRWAKRDILDSSLEENRLLWTGAIKSRFALIHRPSSMSHFWSGGQQCFPSAQHWAPLKVRKCQKKSVGSFTPQKTNETFFLICPLISKKWLTQKKIKAQIMDYLI